MLQDLKRVMVILNSISEIMAGPSEGKNKEGHIIGSCMAMCPNAELRLRQREGLVHQLERAASRTGNQVSHVDPRAMVKEFSRSAAGHQIIAADVRPLPILIKTMKYLLTNVCCREDVPWWLVCQFVGDRVRAVRQDLCVQGLRTPALPIHQAAVRFYVYAQYRACEYDLSEFDPHLNRKQLTETLLSVLTLYQELDKDKINDKHIYNSIPTELSLFTQCDVCDHSSDENFSDDNCESDDSESKIAEDAVASEKSRPTELGKSIKYTGVDQANKNTSTDITNICTDAVEANKITQQQNTKHDSDGSEQDASNISTDHNTHKCTGTDEVYKSKPTQQQNIEYDTDKSKQDTPNTSSESAYSTSISPEERRIKPDTKILNYSMREEAEALNLLVNFGREEVLVHALQLSPEIRECQLVWTTIQMNLAWLSNNYIRVLRLAPLLPPLFLAAFHTHLDSIQRQALTILSAAHSSRAGLVYSGDDLATALLFPSAQALYGTCSHYGLSTGPSGVIFTKGAFNYDAPLIKASRAAWIDERLSSVSLSNFLLPSNLCLSR